MAKGGRSGLRSLVFVGLAALGLSCAEGPSFAVNYAPGFVKEGVTISVFGVFRDGRMNPEAWDELGPRFSAALHHDKGACAIAIGNSLRATHASVFAAVDGVARADGITDELLDKLAPAAKGDSILVITVAGHPPRAKDEKSKTSAAAPSLSPGGSGARGGRRSGGGRARGSHSEPDTDVFEISASLFSKRQHQSVAMLAMTYAGPSEEEAVAKFVERLATTFPSATCAEWNEELGVDAAAIEQSGAK